MFRRLPIFERLISWTKPDAPYPHGSREYELYDHNSLVAEEEQLPGVRAAEMDRSYDVPSRAEMERRSAVRRARRLRVRYGVRWEATRREDDDGFVLETSDGEYRCRAVVFALGVTTPWRAPIPGSSTRRTTSTCSRAAGTAAGASSSSASATRRSRSRTACCRGRAASSSRRRARSGPTCSATRRCARATCSRSTSTCAAGSGRRSSTRRSSASQRTADGFRVEARGTTGRAARVRRRRGDRGDGLPHAARRPDPARRGDGRRRSDPGADAFWESVSVPGVYFAGNATQGSPGLRKQGLSSSSTAVNGFRYNARVLVRHLAEKHFGVEPPRPLVPPDRLVPLLLRELAHAPELWIQKGYLCRIVNRADDGLRDDGILPLQIFVDEPGPGRGRDRDRDGRRRDDLPGRLRPSRGTTSTEHQLAPHPLTTTSPNATGGLVSARGAVATLGRDGAFARRDHARARERDRPRAAASRDRARHGARRADRRRRRRRSRSR